MKKTWLSFLILGALALVGCPTPAEQHALKGLDAFKACDMRTAQREFSAAYDLDTRPDFALAYALSDLAVLLEAPSLTPLYPRLGFTGPIDTSKIWGTGGLLQKLSQRNQTCESLGDFVEASVPHPSLRDNGPSLVSTIDATLTVADLRNAFAPIQDRFDRVASALERSVDREGEVIRLEGGCGTQNIQVQKPELLAIASALRFARAGLFALNGYDGELSIKTLLTTSPDNATQSWVTEMNDHFLRLTDAAAIAGTKPLLRQAIETGRNAISAAAAITATPANALFDWTKFPRPILNDMITGAEFGLAALNAPTAVPFISPTLTADIPSFFTRPPNFNAYTPKFFSLEGGSEPYVQTSSTALTTDMNSRFSPAPFGENAARFEFDVDDRWSGIPSSVWEDTFNPGDRWTTSYDCQ